MPAPEDRPYVIGNFVTTLDGVVSLGIPGQAGGGPISGFSGHDRMVMGLLRAVADAVVVGAGTVRSVPGHLWTPGHVYPALAEEYRELRAGIGKSGEPLTVVVTEQGGLDPGLTLFSGGAPVLVVTAGHGARRLRELGVPATVTTAEQEGRITAHAVLDAIAEVTRPQVILVEGGPQLMGDFFREGCLDELFLTLSPQVAGRDAGSERPALVEGAVFAPERPLWGTLSSAKRAGSHLFLRYAFAPPGQAGTQPLAPRGLGWESADPSR